MELLNHISKRLNSRCDVELPVKSLIDMLQEPSSTPMIKVSYVIYIIINKELICKSLQIPYSGNYWRRRHFAELAN